VPHGDLRQWLSIPIRKCSVEVSPEKLGEDDWTTETWLVLEPEGHGRPIRLRYDEALKCFNLTPKGQSSFELLTGGQLNHELEATERQLVLYVGVSGAARTSGVMLGIQRKGSLTDAGPTIVEDIKARASGSRPADGQQGNASSPPPPPPPPRQASAETSR
jgi:hypothetical protein